MRGKVKRLLLIAPFAIVGMTLFVALGGWIVQLLWNWLAPALFGLPRIGFWQALGLLALCRTLFGGWSSGGGFRSGARRRMDEHRGSMTPEERERLRERFLRRWGDREPSGGDAPTS